MSVLTAIFQAILQAVTWILPISESGHSSLFHDFAAKENGSCAAITGVIHIGVSIGIIIALYKVFFSLLKEFFKSWGDLFNKRLDIKSVHPARQFMFMTVVSFVPMLLWLIPVGKNGFLYNVFRKTAFNSTVLDDGIFFVITGVLVLCAAKQLSIGKNNKNVNIISAVVIGVLSLFFVPVSGLSLVGGVFAAAMLMGVSKKTAVRYSLVLSVPVLIVMGIIEICTATVSADLVTIILGLIISAAAAFVCVRFLQWIINSSKLKYFGIYDIGIGVISFVIGAFELIFNK